MNLSRPEWCDTETFKKIQNLYTIDFEYLYFTDPLKRIGAGRVVKTFLTNVENNNAKSDGGKKIYLYSAHDYNIAAFTIAHNFYPRIPDYGSGVIVEKLRGTDDQVYLRVKMFYRVIFKVTN